MKLFLACMLLPFVTGQKCPPAPTDPVKCKDNELTCGGEIGPDGCPVAAWCKSVDPHARCSERAFCEMQCGPGMMKCAGGVDKDSCPMPETCLPSKTTDGCPAECPIVCGKNELMCDVGRPNETGCPSKGRCLPFVPAAKCPTACDVTCNWGNVEEMFCPSPADPSGCKTVGSCIPVKSPDGKCRNSCPINCKKGEMKCPGGVDENGCPRPDTCMWVDPNSACSSKQICPVHCGPNHTVCPGGTDHDGCPMPDTCLPSKTADGCPAECPMVCGKDEIMCPGTKNDENGCLSKGYCMHHDATAICKTACPVHCGPNHMVCPGKTDARGCKMPDFCIPSIGKT